MNTSLRQRMLYSYIAVMLLVLIGVSIGISVLLREYFIVTKQQELVRKGYELDRIVDSYDAGRIDYNQFTNFINNIDTFLDARVWVIDSDRKVIAISTPRRGGPWMGRGINPGGLGMGSRLIRSLTAEFEPVFVGQVVTKSVYHPVYDENMLIVAVPLQKDDGTVTGAVVLNSPVSGIDEFLRRIYYYIGGVGLLALLVTVMVVRRLAKGITKPLREMQESAAAMARGDYNTRILIDTNDEVGQLGKSLNILAQELARFVGNTAKMEKLRRDFMANISHELRTPLTLIRGYTEALLDGTISAAEAEKYHCLMRDETVRLEGLINELLDLSRLQAGSAPLTVERLPLAAIAEGIVTMLKQRAEQSSVALELEVSAANSEIMGNGDRLTQLMLILLDNALKFTPSGGSIKVAVSRERGKVLLVIQDTGVGIALEDLPFIWERFYKADKAHTRQAGTGLGLAIAREIIDRHGASAEIVSQLGEGTTFRIVFPAAGKPNHDWEG